MKFYNSLSARFSYCRLLTLTIVLHCAGTVLAQSTAFTYQGKLTTNGNLANGLYDLRFKLFADSFGNTQVGSTATSNAVPISSGLFTVTLDFGSVFSGSNYWLEIGVKTNGAGSYTSLSPLQSIAPTPYAIFAQNAGLAAGSYTNAVNFSNAGNTFVGAFTGNGAGLSNVTAATLGGLTANQFWKTSGNSGTTAGANFLGTTDNQPLEMKVNGARALRIEPSTNNAPNLIGGSSINFVDAGIVGATIGGGGTTSTNYFLGVTSNRVGAIFGTIAGGRGQTMLADHGFIGGGINNTIQYFANDSMIGGGVGNLIQSNAFESVIAGGISNSILPNGGYSAIGGGGGNSISPGAIYSVVGGGVGNAIRTNAQYSFVGGGYNNVIAPGSASSVISGGGGHAIQSVHSVIGGGLNNFIQTNANYSAIGGGSFNGIQTNSIFSMIAGGSYNLIRTNALYANIGGGSNNVIGTNASCAFIGGGASNTAAWNFATIGGGYGNYASGNFNGFGDSATVSGGYLNSAVGNNSVVAGGAANFAQASDTAIGGGLYNTNRALAGSIAGGYQNALALGADYGAVGGGTYNQVLGYAAVVPGGYQCLASGNYTFAGGQLAQAVHSGSFVWADSSGAGAFSSTTPNQFAVRAAGGVRFVGNLTLEGGADGAYRRLELSGGNSLGFVYGSFPYFGDGVHLGYNFYADSAGNPHVINAGGGTSRVTATYGEVVIGVGPAGLGPNQVKVDVTTSGVTMTGTVTVNGSFVNNSDRNAKENFKSVSAAQLLDKVTRLPITQWNYKEESSKIQHIGPMAQDFYKVFNVGTDEKHIAPIDEGGVALAAIQGLNEKVEDKVRKLETENAALKTRLEKLERQLLLGIAR